MKLIILLVVLILFPLLCLADQVGVQGGQSVANHGHNAPLDGGSLNAPSLYAYLNTSSQTISCSTTTVVNYDTVLYDNKGWYDTVTYRYTPTISGKYLVIAQAYGQASTTFTGFSITIFKSADQFSISSIVPASTVGITLPVTGILDMNGTTDYITVKTVVNGTGICSLTGTVVAHYTALQIIRISN